MKLVPDALYMSICRVSGSICIRLRFLYNAGVLALTNLKSVLSRSLL